MTTLQSIADSIAQLPAKAEWRNGFDFDPRGASFAHSPAEAAPVSRIVWPEARRLQAESGVGDRVSHHDRAKIFRFRA